MPGQHSNRGYARKPYKSIPPVYAIRVEKEQQSRISQLNPNHTRAASSRILCKLCKLGNLSSEVKIRLQAYKAERPAEVVCDIPL
jgi:hypothetical protein